ncbi:MAG: tRNA dimethylallyltransferase [Planctomycetota bacterium]|jgi:tRNA dimethylallyltransferase
METSGIPSDWILAPLDQVLYLTGPTASGKTQVALRVAERIGAEIISVDSMAVYRGMDIGTAKPTRDEQTAIPHHLIDVRDPDEDYSVAEYLTNAHRIASEIKGRGNRVMFVGGTPLYLKSLICGFFQGPQADWEFRKAVELEVAQVGSERLHERVAQVDPLSAKKIMPNDVRRMTRALEVARITGKPLSHWQTQFEKFVVPPQSRAFVLGWDRAVLHHRVENRVNQMLEIGLIDEVQELMKKFGTLGRTASQAVGYKEPLQYLAGELDYKSMKELITIHTRQFVRRQEIWFRSMPTIERIEMTDSSSLASAVDTICSAV